MKFASNMSKSVVLALTGLVLSPIASADEVAPVESDRYSDQINALKHGDRPQKPVPEVKEDKLPSDEDAGAKGMPEQLKEDYLLAHQNELEGMLIMSLRSMRTEALEHLLPIYAKVPSSRRDDSALMWGDAILTYAKGDSKGAIKKYRELLALLPENKSIRFQLAAALFADAQYDAAKDQFTKLRSDESMAKADLDTVNGYLRAISNKNTATFDMGIQYAYDNNINSAPKQGTEYKPGEEGGGSASREKPLVGRGFNYSVDTSKRWVFDNRMYVKIAGSLWGTHYWTARSYSDLGLKLTTGVGYDNGKLSWSLSPYAQKKLYGYGSRGEGRLHNYYKSLGLSTNLGYWFTNSFKNSVGVDFGKDTYIDQYKANTGPYLSAYWQMYYYPKKTRYFYSTLSYFGKNTEAYKYNSFHRVGVRLGWYQEWPKGFSTTISGSYGYRWYSAPDPFLRVSQNRQEWNAQLTLWHKAIHFKGITPQLVFSYNNVKSNVSLYSHSGAQVFVDFSKRF